MPAVILNALLVGVMALIIFSLQEMTKSGKQAIQLYTLLALSIITILINCVALYSIIFRLVEFGFSANRVAVIGAGAMGNGIAHTFAQSGYKVQLIDVNQEALSKALQTISKNLDRLVSKGKIEEATLHYLLKATRASAGGYVDTFEIRGIIEEHRDALHNAIKKALN